MTTETEQIQTAATTTTAETAPIASEDLNLVDEDALAAKETDEGVLWQEFDEQEADAAAAAEGKTAADKAANPDSADAAASDAERLADGEGTAADEGAADPHEEDDDGTKPDGGTPSGKGADQPDIWAGATPEQRAAFEAAQEEAKAAPGLREQLDRRMREIKRLKSQTTLAHKPAAGSAAGSGEGTRSDDAMGMGKLLESDDWKTLKKEYPEIASPIEGVMDAMRQQLASQGKMLDAIGDDRVQDALDAQESALLEAHPDWITVVGKDQAKFDDWVTHQPRHIREAAARNSQLVVDADEAGDVIARYKAFLAGTNGSGNGQDTGANGSPKGGSAPTTPAPLSDRRKQQLESATTTRTRSPGPVTGVDQDGDPEVIWKQMERAGL